MIKKTHEKHMKTIVFTLRSSILINFVKKNRLAAGSLPGVTLGGEHASGGPLRGGLKGPKIPPKISFFVKIGKTSDLPAMSYFGIT